MSWIVWLIIWTVFTLSPLIFVISRMLDYFDGNCFLSGHAWCTGEKVYMRPVRYCTKCGQVQVKLPKLDKVSKGGWINHDFPLNNGKHFR